MAESGINVLLKIGDGADPEVFTELAGQKSTQLNLTSSPVDTSNKTTGGWGRTLAGLNNGTVTCSGTAEWPDTAGIKRLETVFGARGTINCELIVNTAGDKWAGAFSITSLDISGDDNGAAVYSLNLQNAGALVKTDA
ncbi:phage tail tube protein [Kiloniella majae]|uniref:phage tail tube protein n=1 Tax=Kiloniella majae TaxID=1938558 RepID=UPI000A278A64|nr:phage tail tube protein [Kiloniella majae]